MKKLTLTVGLAVSSALLPLTSAWADPTDPPTNGGGGGGLTSLTSCAFSPSEVTLNSGDSVDVTATNTGGNGAYVEYALGSQVQGGVAPVSGTSSTTTMSYAQLSSYAGSTAVDLLLNISATDGTNKVGSPLCTLTIHLGALPVSTTVPPVTLPHTGSNTGTLLMGSALLVSAGAVLVATGRRRRGIDA